MIEELLPSSVVAVESRTDPVVPPQLFPEEERLVARAVAKRRREFGTVRECARAALARLGGPRVPLLPGERGAPRWPDGFIGSMTHCDGYRAAAVARATDLAGVGLDAEPNEPIPGEGVLATVTLPGERARLPELAERAPRVAFDRLMFSAKESVYKAWFPLTGRWLGFAEADVTVRVTAEDAGTFTARLLVPGPVVGGVALSGFEGRWLARDGLVLTAVTVPHPVRDDSDAFPTTSAAVP